MDKVKLFWCFVKSITVLEKAPKYLKGQRVNFLYILQIKALHIPLLIMLLFI